MEDSLKEIKVLIEYMIKHNNSHNKELIDLANKIKLINEEAYNQIINAYNFYSNGNDELQKALEILSR